MQFRKKYIFPKMDWLDAFPEIKSVNRQLLEKEIPCLIVSVSKITQGTGAGICIGHLQKKYMLNPV